MWTSIVSSAAGAARKSRRSRTARIHVACPHCGADVTIPALDEPRQMGQSAAALRDAYGGPADPQVNISILAALSSMMIVAGVIAGIMAVYAMLADDSYESGFPGILTAALLFMAAASAFLVINIARNTFWMARRLEKMDRAGRKEGK